MHTMKPQSTILVYIDFTKKRCGEKFWTEYIYKQPTKTKKRLFAVQSYKIAALRYAYIHTFTLIFQIELSHSLTIQTNKSWK